ncbi:hypothetical protein C0993_000959 [Termitomyces sp. T159_Od127]|nr:hypothetical protein C0993_000959 [Termitomyces sp. T159_Od127]
MDRHNNPPIVDHPKYASAVPIFLQTNVKPIFQMTRRHWLALATITKDAEGMLLKTPIIQRSSGQLGLCLEFRNLRQERRDVIELFTLAQWSASVDQGAVRITGGNDPCFLTSNPEEFCLDMWVIFPDGKVIKTATLVLPPLAHGAVCTFLDCRPLDSADPEIYKDDPSIIVDCTLSYGGKPSARFSLLIKLRYLNEVYRYTVSPHAHRTYAWVEWGVQHAWIYDAAHDIPQNLNSGHTFTTQTPPIPEPPVAPPRTKRTSDGNIVTVYDWKPPAPGVVVSLWDLRRLLVPMPKLLQLVSKAPITYLFRSHVYATHIEHPPTYRVRLVSRAYPISYEGLVGEIDPQIWALHFLFTRGFPDYVKNTQLSPWDIEGLRVWTHRLERSGGRNYDYTTIYGPDKPGEEAKENARVWNVYLDEAENYDADMIQGFRNIIDGLLVFAALFSAIVATFVVQTFQALQPDNAQIIASLLFENNQLLRAAGNRTSISAVPAAELGPGSRTSTSIDAWVNVLFFTSLTLSLSTALLTVLAKQWIQAYTTIVPGGAKTRALIRHFRFQGLMKWKLGDIIESLPLVLHSSVAIFLVGLALYVSQLSSAICGVVSVITSLAFLFYIGTSMLPAFDITCPYRIPFMFSLAQIVLIASHIARYVFLFLRYPGGFNGLQHVVARRWRGMSKSSLKMTEHHKVFAEDDTVFSVPNHLACDSLGWAFNHSSNHTVKEAVIKGACGLLDEWSSKIKVTSYLSKILISSSTHDNLLLSTLLYSLSQLPHMSSTLTTEDEVEKSTYGRLVGNLMKTCLKSLLTENIADLKVWREEVESALIESYGEAVRGRYRALSRRLLDWGHPLVQSARGRLILFACAQKGGAEDIRDLVDRGMDLTQRDRPDGWTALHYAAVCGNLDSVVALVEREPNLIYDQANRRTALDLAITMTKPNVVAYLLDHGANPPSHALHVATQLALSNPDGCLPLMAVFLDRGWDRAAKDVHGMTAIDIARGGDCIAIVEYLEHYHTVRLPPISIASLDSDERGT